MSAFFEEAEISQSEYVRSAFLFWDVCPEIFTRPHGKKDSCGAQLGNGNVFIRRLYSMELPDYAEWERLLLFDILVLVFISFVLLL